MRFLKRSFFLRALIALTALYLFVGSLRAEETQKVTADKERLIKTVQFLSEENFPRTTLQENKKKTIEYLTRTVQDAGLKTTRGEFIIKEILGDDEVAIELQRYTFVNIHALKKGKTDKRIIIGAHYDAVHVAPGADDNASGVAALVELAYFLKKTPELNCDVEIVFYDLEEDGLLGSRYHAKKLKSQNIDVVCMICLDMIGYYSDKENSQSYPPGLWGEIGGTKGDFLVAFGGPKDTQLVADAEKVFREATTLKILATPTPKALEEMVSTFSDHAPFWEEGYPILLFTDTADFRNGHYHSATDTWDTLDYDRLAQVPVGIYHVILAVDASRNTGQ